MLVEPETGQPRAVAETAAERAGVRAAALATSPVPVEPKVVGTSRYRRMADVFGLTAHEQLTCGCHVHVGKAASRMRTEVLRLAAWRASRSSLDDVLLSPVTGLPEPAASVVAS